MDPREHDAIIKAFDERIDTMYKRLAGEFRGRHDLNRQDTTRIQQQITALAEKFEHIERRLDDIERQTGTNLVIGKALGAATGEDVELPVPEPGTPRPAAIDRACSASPGEGPVMVLIPEYGLEIEPEPGSDPDAIWSDAVGRISEVRRPRRSRRR